MERPVAKTAAAMLVLAPFTWLIAVGITFAIASAWGPATNLCPAPLPDGTRPTLVTLIAPQHDAWTRLPNKFQGHAYLRRVPAFDTVIALSARHGPFGVMVDFDVASNCFQSQCFNVSFDLDGAAITEDDALRNRIKPLEIMNCRVVNNHVLVCPTKMEPERFSDRSVNDFGPAAR